MKKLVFGVAITVLASSWASAQFLQQGTKLVGTGAVGAAQQGISVALSADGSTAIVGGSKDSFVSGESYLGAAWAFTRSAGVWSQQGEKFIGTGAVVGANQGRSVALSGDGNTAIVGGYADNGYTGAAWMFTRAGGAWTQQGEKLVGTGASGSPYQGSSVALCADGTTAIVGGFMDTGGIGATWVFTRSGSVWAQQGEKLVGLAFCCAHQGWSVALSADGATAIVGAYGVNGYTGATWMFTRADGVWTQQGERVVGTGAVGTAMQGHSVALSADGNTAIVGGPSDTDVGATWVFTRSGGVWTQQGEKLVGTGAVGKARQGYSVALSADGNTAIVGGPSDNNYAGAAWVFARLGGVWTQLGSKLVGTDAAGSAHQGASVALSADGTTAIVGGYGDSSNTGAVWVFTRSGSQGNVLWVPVVAHNPGLKDSQWRSDLGLLNTGSGTANVQIEFFGSGGVVTHTTYVPAGTQSILTDVVGQLSASGQGALEVLSDQPLKVTSRTYNQVSPGASCYPNGTQGQDYPTVVAGDGLDAGQSAYLAGLTENASYRCNIGLVNVGSGAATVLVELYNGAGTNLTDYPVALGGGQWAQETQPFKNKAGQTAMDRGYAKVTVTSGAGVVAFASVVDNITNDPTTVTMQR
jgi:flagellar basal body rod protein FlgF